MATGASLKDEISRHPICIQVLCADFFQLKESRSEVERNEEQNNHTQGLSQGLPQGSSISPVLFLIFINVELKPETMLSLFADDTSIYKCGGYMGNAIRRKRSGCCIGHSYSSRWTK